MRRLWIARHHSGPRAIVSHEAAAQLHGLHEAGRDRVVLIPSDQRRHALTAVVWHRLTDVAPFDVVRADGLPVTTLPRTAVDLAAVISRHRLGKVVEEMIVTRSVRAASIGAVLSRIRRSGKRGVRHLELTLDDLGPGIEIARSVLEPRLDDVLQHAGLDGPSREHPLPSMSGDRGFVDRCFPEARLIIEADGRRWHERRAAMADDRRRDLEAAQLGYLTLRLTYEQLTEEPFATARAIRRVYDLRLAEISRAS